MPGIGGVAGQPPPQEAILGGRPPEFGGGHRDDGGKRPPGAEKDRPGQEPDDGAGVARMADVPVWAGCHQMMASLGLEALDGGEEPVGDQARSTSAQEAAKRANAEIWTPGRERDQ